MIECRRNRIFDEKIKVLIESSESYKNDIKNIVLLKKY